MKHPCGKSRMISTLSAIVIYFNQSAGVLGQAILPGQIHAYPSDQTASAFKQHQLSFQYPNDGLARVEFKSDEFYAIVLKSGEKCSLSNGERAKIQGLFPQNKVFMDLFGCEDEIEENITYTNTNPDYSFIAVFGGTNFEQASQLFKQYDLANKFPGANIRKMQAVLVYA